MLTNVICHSDIAGQITYPVLTTVNPQCGTLHSSLSQLTQLERCLSPDVISCNQRPGQVAVYKVPDGPSFFARKDGQVRLG
jgi:hypothetical protein